MHFFLDTTERDDAGTNGDPPDTWNLTDEPTSFLTEFTPEGSGGATQMRAAVADVHHGVFRRGGDDTGNCVALPS